MLDWMKHKLESGLPGEISITSDMQLQSCPTLCNPIDGSPPGSSVPGILQARILEWVTISFSTSFAVSVKFTWFFASYSKQSQLCLLLLGLLLHFTGYFTM